LKIFALFVLGKGEPDKALNRDAKMRCMAARMFLKHYGLMRVYFVGGKPERKENTPVSVKMKEYFDSLMGYPSISEALCESNNSFGNVQEIIDIAGRKNSIRILANKYQIPRFIKIFLKLGVNRNQIIPISAEEMLMRDPKNIEEITKYRNSFKYKLRIVLEKMLTLWMIFDPEYRIITAWRKIRRKYL